MTTDKHYVWYLAGAREWHYSVNEYFGSGYISAYDGEKEVMGDFITESPYEYSSNIRNTYGQDYGYCKRILIDNGDLWKGLRYIPSGSGAMYDY